MKITIRPIAPYIIVASKIFPKHEKRNSNLAREDWSTSYLPSDTHTIRQTCNKLSEEGQAYIPCGVDKNE